MTLPIHPDAIKAQLKPLLAKFISPANLGRISTKMPERLNFLVVNQLINKAFEEQVDDGDFDFLQGRSLQIEIIDAGVYVSLTKSGNKLTCSHFSDQQHVADVTLSIDVANAIALLNQEVDPDTLFFQRKLKINGDTELAHHVKNTIDTLDPDVIPRFVLTLMNEYQEVISGT